MSAEEVVERAAYRPQQIATLDRSRPGLLAAAVSVHFGMPCHPPKIRARKLANPAHAVLVAQEKIRTILGDEHLYTDMEFLTVTGVLAHPCHAVVWEKSEHHGGVSMDWEGRFPDVARRALPAGVLYLTVDPGGRESLWSGGRSRSCGGEGQ